MLYRCLFMCRVITAVFECCVVMFLIDECMGTRFPITVVSDIVAFVLKRDVQLQPTIPITRPASSTMMPPCC